MDHITLNQAKKTLFTNTCTCVLDLYSPYMLRRVFLCMWNVRREMKLQFVFPEDVRVFLCMWSEKKKEFEENSASWLKGPLAGFQTKLECCPKCNRVPGFGKIESEKHTSSIWPSGGRSGCGVLRHQAKALRSIIYGSVWLSISRERRAVFEHQVLCVDSRSAATDWQSPAPSGKTRRKSLTRTSSKLVKSDSVPCFDVVAAFL